ncbi:hypothetical protein [Segatella copri]|uniref:hypothetical protein n=1 Tax=Segatella copri TaxID=165179 RepID=UPI001290A72F|nr:hypothetical protein [Segatella copri]
MANNIEKQTGRKLRPVHLQTYFFLIHIKYFSLKHLDIKEKNRIFAASFKITLKGKQYGCSYK